MLGMGQGQREVWHAQCERKEECLLHFKRLICIALPQNRVLLSLALLESTGCVPDCPVWIIARKQYLHFKRRAVERPQGPVCLR